MAKTELQTSTLPFFNFPVEMQWLYEHGFDIEFEKINAILALDKELLISDLNSALDDSIVRYEYFNKRAETEGYNDENFNFPGHAILLLIELKAENTLDQLLEVLKQDEDYYNFWFGDFLHSFALPAIFLYGLNQKGKLLNLLKQPKLYLYSKFFVSEAVIRIPAKFPEKRTEILNWCREWLNFYIEKSEDPAYTDIEYAGLLISSITDAGLHELLPEIKQLFESKSVAVYICGDYKEIVEDIHSKDFVYYDQLEKSIFENYNILNGDFDGLEIKNEDGFEKGFFNDSRFINELQQPEYKLPKIGRNDPCPCGSGKKYKKCCLNSN